VDPSDGWPPVSQDGLHGLGAAAVPRREPTGSFRHGHRQLSLTLLGRDSSDFARLARAGVRISYYHSSSGFYIHGKIIEADYGTRHAKVFIGSENFSNTSLNQNRELGLITASHAVMSSIARTFAIDFRHGKRWFRPHRSWPGSGPAQALPRPAPPPGPPARQQYGETPVVPPPLCGS
jgi:hypothetical protein